MVIRSPFQSANTALQTFLSVLSGRRSLSPFYANGKVGLQYFMKSPIEKLQYSRGGTGVSPWWDWSSPTVGLASQQYEICSP